MDMLTPLLAASVAAATPLMLAGIGELLAERAGVLNIGIEGMMLTGCIAGFSVAVITGSPWLGLLAAIGAAMLVGSVFAFLAINARTDQIVAGMAINLLAVGLSGTIWRILQNRGLTELPENAGFLRGWTGVDMLTTMPLFGPLLFNHYGLTAVTLLAAAIVWWILRRTRLGIVVTALGEAPDAVAAAGESVRRWRWFLVLVAAACAGAAGAYLSIMRTHAFVPLMTGGSGFVVLALVMFGRWRVWWMVSGCLLFGCADSLQQSLQSLPQARQIPYQVFHMLPYLVALTALALLSRSAPGPAALGRPWPVE